MVWSTVVSISGQGRASTSTASANTHTCDARQGTFRYGVAIRREHWRRGYASEAIRLVLAYFFRELRYQKLTSMVYSFNERSLRMQSSTKRWCQEGAA